MEAWEQIFDFILDGVAVIDRKGSISYVNPAFAQLLGVSQKRSRRQPIEKILPIDSEVWQKVGPLSALRDPFPYYRFPFAREGQVMELGLCLIPQSAAEDSSLVMLLKDFSLEARLHTKYQLTMKQNEQIYKAHQKRLFEVLFLSAIAEAADSASSAEQLFEKFLPKIVEITDIDAIGFYLPTAKGDFQGKGFATKRTVSRDLVESIYLNHTTQMQTGFEMEEPETFLVQTFQAARVPMIRREKTVGVALVLKAGDQPVSQDEVQMIWVMSEHIAAHLERIALREDVITDSLTQVYNTRFFHHRLAAELNQQKTQKGDLSLVIFDVDFFKKVNDTYGHQTGDLILKQVALVAKKCLRGADSIARIGGEEFVAILPNTALEPAKLVAERIRKAIEAHLPDPQRPELKVTASFGVSHAPSHGWDKDRLVAVADAALYEAKKNGRNRVVVGSAESSG
jgi:diguanylate cyclase (GGDEF)-like protein